MAKFEPKPFGKYFLTQKIAVGGMAEIYKAKTFGVDGFEKVMAIKKILPQYSADRDFTNMLTDEAKLVVQLSHANIVQVFDLGVVDDDYFISMEYIDGVNLRQLMEQAIQLKQKIPEELCLYLASEVCKGLDYAHNKRGTDGHPLEIVHRDISPHNVLVSFEGAIKLTDFGIAKAVQNISQTNNGMLKGKVTYMSPEQALGKPLDGRTDLYSLGIILYELLTLKRLYTGDSQMEILKKIQKAKYTRKDFSNIPKHLRDFMMKALAYNPNDRFDSASDMQIALTRILFSHYSRFNPKDLQDRLNIWFNDATDLSMSVKMSLDKTKPGNQTILVSAERSEQSVDILEQETLKPDEKFNPDDFKDEKSITEHSGKNKVAYDDFKQSADQAVQDLINHKKKKKKSIILLFILVGAIALGLLYWQMQTDSPIADPQPNQQELLIDRPQKADPVNKSILLQTNPSGVTVLWNDKQLPAVTPLRLERVEVGKTFQIILKKEGYLTKTIDLDVVSDTPNVLNYVLEKAPPQSYNLKIQTTPKEATLFIDGKEHSKTDSLVHGLEVGQTYKIEVKLEGYKSITKEFFANEAEEQELNLELEKLPYVVLSIQSNPEEAQILINGKDTNQKTPATIKDILIPQDVTVTLKKEGYLDFEKKLSLKEIIDQNLSFTLKKVPPVLISVLISSNIRGAEVFVNDDLKGKTPLKVDLEPQEYKVVVRKAGFKQESKTVKLDDKIKNKKYYFRLRSTAPPPAPIQKNGGATNIKSSSTNVSKFSSLRVDSSPRGAAVKINGAPKGITPIVINGLNKNQPVTITVTKSGFKTWTRTIQLNKDRIEIKANLE